MSLFKKRVAPEKITVRYGGGENDLIWRKEILDCAGDCEVVTDAFYKVVYFKNGQVQEDMSGNRFLLNTFEKKEKKQETFDIRLYFVNVSNAYTVKWGTRQQTRVIDGFYQVPVSIGASGTFKITVNNAHKLVTKLCSVRSDLSTSYIQEFFGEQMTMYVMQNLTQEIISGRTNAYTLWQNAADVAHNMQSSLENVFDEYGITVSGFAISNIVLSEADIRQFEEILRKRRLLEMQDTSFREQAQQQKEDRKSAVDAIVKLASIEANKSQPSVTINNNGANQPSFCPYCGAKLTPGASFCPTCGKRVK